MMNEPKRILVVDDDPKILFILSAALAGLGTNFEVTTAGNGRNALAKIAADHFDLIITDIQMPDINGIELTKKVRAMQPNIPMVWITGYGSPHTHAESDRLGVYKCLDKPVKIGEIRRTALDALGMRGYVQ